MSLKPDTQGFPQGSKVTWVRDGSTLRWALVGSVLTKVPFDTDLLYVTERAVCKSPNFLFVEEETGAFMWK